MSQFLTKLTRPKMWDGYPLLLSALVGDIEDDLKIVLKGYNVAGALLATNESDAASYTDSVVDFNVNEVYGSLTSVSYIVAHVESNLGEVLTDTITIDVVSPCANPVYLLARNSLGGCLNWMFDVSQEYAFDLSNARKAKRLVLFTNNLSSNQWDGLQDFVTLGEVYRNNIVELTSATIKTSSRIDQQIYDVDTDGDKIGVVALPTKNSTLTRRVKHQFELEIEYPEVF
jgi:hypothetical protein